MTLAELLFRFGSFFSQRFALGGEPGLGGVRSGIPLPVALGQNMSRRITVLGDPDNPEHPVALYTDGPARRLSGSIRGNRAVVLNLRNAYSARARSGPTLERTGKRGGFGETNEIGRLIDRDVFFGQIVNRHLAT